MAERPVTTLPKGASKEEILASLPVRARVRPGRFVFTFVFCLACLALFVWVIFWPPEDASAGFKVWRVLAFFGVPMIMVVLPWSAMALFRPRHVTFDEERVWTRAWSVDWVDVKRVAFLGATKGEHNLQIVLAVEKAHWSEGGLRQANRWDSGNPFGSGGLTRPEPEIRTQQCLAPSALAVGEAFEELVRQARRRRPQLTNGQRAERARERWGDDGQP